MDISTEFGTSDVAKLRFTCRLMKDDQKIFSLTSRPDTVEQLDEDTFVARFHHKVNVELPCETHEELKQQPIIQTRFSVMAQQLPANTYVLSLGIFSVSILMFL